ncbi:thermonuclease family protein [Pontixanthobacter aquaemixtae]|uniref:TNase-like domain-containing protein n=1 Tax=Pontixanthobacter aquaemixtae TaxID=1958940 RepID=A0A844ZPS5_9SPHN|nr:thermonuclease family protein [Pontixanthobacter aquaemixtae]MXO89743.1 hypothetical protein [Pontixanthobacter aquaemixtae]
MKQFLGLMAFLAAMFGAPQMLAAQVVSGKATVIDGDTLDLTGTRVRLMGIDAPEAGQTCKREDAEWQCGKEATDFLKLILQNNEVECRTTGRDTYARLLAFCSSGGHDLGLGLVGAGLAVVSNDGPEEYKLAQEIRITHKIGIWGSEFQTPAEWRASHPELFKPAQEQQKPQQAKRQRPTPERVYRNEFGCAIKGNRNRRGQWIYHLPGRPYYDQTRPEELFCTESQARRAGYRRSKA